MGDWDVVEGVGYPYVAKGHLISWQARGKEDGMAVWDLHAALLPKQAAVIHCRGHQQHSSISFYNNNSRS